MKIFTTCMECINEFGHPNLECKLQEVKNDGIYENTCSNGHKTYTLLSGEKFQLLFDMGLDALKKGYKHEAVTCFTNSLERFYEWFISYVSLKHDINYDSFEETWGCVSVQSERQLGAFYFFYLLEFKKAPESINGNKTKFRNRVIHQGLIPSYEQVYNYGEYILKYINNVVEELKKNNPKFNETVSKVYFSRTSKLHLEYSKQGKKINSMSMSHAINIHSKTSESFKDALESVEKAQSMLAGFEQLSMGGTINDSKGTDR